jgi:hypothetical protein
MVVMVSPSIPSPATRLSARTTCFSGVDSGKTRALGPLGRWAWKDTIVCKRIGAALAAAALTLPLGAPIALAGSSNAGCRETVTSQRASTLHDVGEHASSFAGSARLGLANVARVVLGADATVGDLGAALGSLDGLDETDCP